MLQIFAAVGQQAHIPYSNFPARQLDVIDSCITNVYHVLRCRHATDDAFCRRSHAYQYSAVTQQRHHHYHHASPASFIYRRHAIFKRAVKKMLHIIYDDDEDISRHIFVGQQPTTCTSYGQSAAEAFNMQCKEAFMPSGHHETPPRCRVRQRLAGDEMAGRRH